jgi:Rrf2 family protein
MMLRISKAEDQAIRLCMRLAKQSGQQTLSVLAAQEAMPEPTAAKLLGLLRRGGIVAALRGRNGGYELAAPPAEISVAAVLRSLGDPAPPHHCLEPDFESSAPQSSASGSTTSDSATAKGTVSKNATSGNTTSEKTDCPRLSNCGLRSVWRHLQDQVTRLLEGTSLADLLGTENSVDEHMARLWPRDAVGEQESGLPAESVAADTPRERS